MKQRITVEQISELTEEQRQKLIDWWKPECGDHFTTYYENYGWTYNNVVGSCAGYNNCECTIDDKEDPSEKSEDKSLPLLSIGQMIEMLSENQCIDINNIIVGKAWSARLIKDNKEFLSEELIFALWDAVKTIL